MAVYPFPATTNKSRLGQGLLLSLSESRATVCCIAGLQLSVVLLLLRWEAGKVMTGKRSSSSV